MDKIECKNNHFIKSNIVIFGVIFLFLKILEKFEADVRTVRINRITFLCQINWKNILQLISDIKNLFQKQN